MMPRQAIGCLDYGIHSSCKALVVVVVEHQDQDMSRSLGVVQRRLGGLAKFESDLIRARTGEGRARAKAHQRAEAFKRRERRTRWEERPIL